MTERSWELSASSTRAVVDVRHTRWGLLSQLGPMRWGQVSAGIVPSFAGREVKIRHGRQVCLTLERSAACFAGSMRYEVGNEGKEWKGESPCTFV